MPMRYELYVDSLFLINFIMNLYILKLVDYAAFRTATSLRLLAGAAFGAACFLLPFAGRGPVALKLAAGLLAGSAGMLCITFPVRSLRMFLKLMEKLVLYSFGMGGAMLFLVRCLPLSGEILAGVFGILGIGAAAFLFFCRCRPDTCRQDSFCRATLSRGDKNIQVNALIDSGNGLTEPISGKPVCIIDRKIFREFWGEDRDIFRAIPYHSIGKKRGILPGYLLPKLQLETEGLELVFADVYIAVSDEEISGTGNAGAESVNMIINPGLFAESRRGSRARRQNERYNDTESDDTGQDAV